MLFLNDFSNKTHVRVVFCGLFPAVCVDLPQQVLDAAIVELVAPVAVLIQSAHLAHQEVWNLRREGTRQSINSHSIHTDVCKIR